MQQDTAADEAGNNYYTGDAPSCLVDQKAAARYVKYNILLGNLPGNVEYLVSTGGSGGGAHAAMFAATSNNSDYYDYQIEAGAVGVYKNGAGGYSTTVTIAGKDYELSDGAWGCIAYSAITSLYEADMALAFEYNLNTEYSFKTSFQEQMAEFKQNLQWYLDNLDYAEGWTWFDEEGNALRNEDVASMTSEDKAQAFIEGRYTKSSNGNMMGHDMPEGNVPNGEKPDGNMPSGETPNNNIQKGEESDKKNSNEMIVGTPDHGTTQSATGSGDSANYETYEEMVAAYKADIEEIEKGDKYGNNIVYLYNPLNYINNDNTDNPKWTKIIMGAAEGDMSLFSSLNLQLAWLNAGVDAEIEWQWDGGYVPSEVLGESFSLYIDQMYGEYVDNAVAVSKQEPTKQTENGTSEEATGTRESENWVKVLLGLLILS